MSDSSTCSQLDTCAIPCPATWSSREALRAYGWAVVVSIVIVTLCGLACVVFIKGKKENFFVGGRNMSLLFITTMLMSQALDSNATLGAADLAYKFAYFDGAVLPIGLAISLFLNAIFFARHINRAYCLTLPDFYGRTYGSLVEILVGLICCASFIALLAGNLVGMARILEFSFSDSENWVFLTATITLLYTGAGGLFGVAYTDLLQASMGFTGLIVAVAWCLKNFNPNVPPPSVGFVGYSYPDQDICDTYQGVPGTYQTDYCVYNEAVYGPNGVDNGAYPYGDKVVNSKGMTSQDAYAPFPNAVFYNWATLAILGFGNLAALDFQVRCMAARTPSIATWANVGAACITVVIGVMFAYMGGFMRLYYGPDSKYAEFAVDTCSQQLGLPTCAQWLPDEYAYLRLATLQMPLWLGAWSLIGITAASMSTSNGAILAVGSVCAHNIGRRVLRRFSAPSAGEVTDAQLLKIVRVVMIPVTFTAACVAAWHNETGKLLIVAFDIVLAGCVAPLFACVYGKSWVTPGGGLAGVLGGTLLRVILQVSS
ncbi:unnamed protein product [Phaeothamnion confervicola]